MATSVSPWKQVRRIDESSGSDSEDRPPSAAKRAAPSDAPSAHAFGAAHSVPAPEDIDKLRADVVKRGGDPSLVEGWTAVRIRRGTSNGTYPSYTTPGGTTLRSKVECLRMLGLAEDSKQRKKAATAQQKMPTPDSSDESDDAHGRTGVCGARPAYQSDAISAGPRPGARQKGGGMGGEKVVASTKRSDGSAASGGGGAVDQPPAGMAASGLAQRGPLTDGEVQRIRSVGFDEDDGARQVHGPRTCMDQRI